jgi:hypothetical protein
MCDTISSAGTYVPVIHRFLHQGGEDRPTSEKALTQKNQIHTCAYRIAWLQESHSGLRPALPALPRPAGACKERRGNMSWVDAIPYPELKNCA